MKKINNLRLLATMVVWFAVLGANAQEGNIFYHEKALLDWADFKGEQPETAKKYFAVTEWGIKFKMDFAGDSIYFIVLCEMDPNTSWAVPSKKTDDLLAHEQGHYNLAEIYARKLRKEYNRETFTEEDLEVKSGEIYSRIFDECAGIQMDYDRDTKHGINKEQQTLWEHKIKNMLEEYSSFAQAKVARVLN